MSDQFVAKSASDRRDDWPCWMVWNNSRNVTNRAIAAFTGVETTFQFVPRRLAEIMAEVANKRGFDFAALDEAMRADEAALALETQGGGDEQD